MLRDEHFDGDRTGYERNVVQWALHPAATARRSRGDNDLSPVPVRVLDDRVLDDAPYHFIAERFANSASHAIHDRWEIVTMGGRLVQAFEHIYWQLPHSSIRIYIT